MKIQEVIDEVNEAWGEEHEENMVKFLNGYCCFLHGLHYPHL